MEILVGLALTFAVGAALLYFSGYSDGRELAGIVLCFLSGILLVIATASIPFERMVVHASLREVEAVRATFTAARTRGQHIENAAMQVKAAEINQWLASKKFYNATVFDIWIPDEVEAVEPIQ